MAPLTTDVLADIDRLIEMQGPEDDAGGSFWQETGRNYRDMARDQIKFFQAGLRPPTQSARGEADRGLRAGSFAQAVGSTPDRVRGGFSGSRS